MTLTLFVRISCELTTANESRADQTSLSVDVTGRAHIARGRGTKLAACCSRAWAIQPAVRPTARNNEYPGDGRFAGEIYNVGYARAMLQAALTL